MSDAITETCNNLMRAVARSGCIREGRTADYTLGARIMREELKAFLFADQDQTDKYSDERALTLTGQSGLAMSSLVAECIRRILGERAP